MQKKAFTLIELLISMTIFFILVMVSYIPYNFYMNKVKVRNTIKEISQSLYEARNMAINWMSNDYNRSVWLYVDVTNNPLQIQFISYPYTFTWSQITNIISSDIEIIKTYDLIKWMEIRSVNWKNNLLFYFNAITWEWSYFYWDSSWNRLDIIDTEIEVDFSYKEALEWSPLYWKIKYFTKTNIVDY